MSMLTQEGVVRWPGGAPMLTQAGPMLVAGTVAGADANLQQQLADAQAAQAEAEAAAAAAQQAYEDLLASGTATQEELDAALAAANAANAAAAAALAAQQAAEAALAAAAPTLAAYTAAFPTTYYVDSSVTQSGNGINPYTPLSSSAELNALSLAPGTTILYKAGLYYPGVVTPQANGLRYGRYGAGANPIWWRGKDLASATWTQSTFGRWSCSAAFNVQPSRCSVDNNLTEPVPYVAAAADVGRDYTTASWTQYGGSNVWSCSVTGLTSPGFVDFLSINGAYPTRSEEYLSHVIPNQSWMYKSTNATSGTIYLYSGSGNPSASKTITAGGGWFKTGTLAAVTVWMFCPDGNPSTVRPKILIDNAAGGNTLNVQTPRTGTQVSDIDIAYGSQGVYVSSTDLIMTGVRVYGNGAGVKLENDGPGASFTSCSFSRNGAIAQGTGQNGIKIGTGGEKIERTNLLNCIIDQNGEDGVAEQCGGGSYIVIKGCLSKRNNENGIDCKQFGTHYIQNSTFISRNWLQGGAGVGAGAFQADTTVYLTDCNFISDTSTGLGSIQLNPRVNALINRCKAVAVRGPGVGIGTDKGTTTNHDALQRITGSLIVTTDRDSLGLFPALMISSGASASVVQCTISNRGDAANNVGVRMLTSAYVISASASITNCIIHNESTTGYVIDRNQAADANLKLNFVNNIFWSPNLTTTWGRAQTGVNLSDTQLDSGINSVLNFDGQTGNFTAGLVVTGGTSGATASVTAQSDSGATGTLYLFRTGTGAGAIPFLDNEAITDTSTGAAVVNGVENTSFVVTDTIADPTVNPLFTNPWAGGTTAEDEYPGDYSLPASTPAIGTTGSLWSCLYSANTASFSQGEPIRFLSGSLSVATAWIRNDFTTASRLVISGLTGSVASGNIIQGLLSGGVATVSGSLSSALTLKALAWSAQGTAFTTLGQVVTGGTSGHTGILVQQTPSGSTGRFALAVTASQTFQNGETITGASNGSRTVSGTASASPAKRVYPAPVPPVPVGLNILPLDFARFQSGAVGSAKQLNWIGDGTTVSIQGQDAKFVAPTNGTAPFQTGDTFVMTGLVNSGSALNNVILTVSSVSASLITALSALQETTASFTASVSVNSTAITGCTRNLDSLGLTGGIIRGPGIPAGPPYTVVSAFTNPNGTLSTASTATTTSQVYTITSPQVDAAIFKLAPMSAGMQSAS